MASKLLPVHMSSARYQNERILDTLSNGRPPSHRRVLTFCRNYRILAIGSLLLYAEPDPFKRYLHKSGRAYLHLTQAMPDRHKPTSRALPFFDAVVALDLDGAAAIAASASPTRNPDLEYDEDFLYVRFLMKHFFASPTPGEEHVLLTRYERALEGTRDDRLALCKALVDGDAAAFDEALALVLEERADRAQRLADDERLEPEVWATEAQVSIEGLALVILAERAGLETRRDYLLVPSLAREGGPAPADPDAWRQVDG